MAARVLLIAADPTIQRSGSATLRNEGYEVTVAPDATDGLRRWTNEHPDLVVVDSVMPTGDGYVFVQELRATEEKPAHMPVILIGDDMDLESKIRAFRAGADDYIAKPLNPAELAARSSGLLLHIAPSPPVGVRRPQTHGVVHAWYGAKGGVGTTTLAINTAIALVRETKQSVVLVDANLQLGDHRVFVDLGPDKHSIVDAVTAQSIDSDLLRRCVVRHESGVYLLLAPSQPEAAEHVSAEMHHLYQVVDLLRGMYDYVLVDLDQRLDDHTLDVVSTADVLYMVMTADLACLKNVRLLLETLGQVGVPGDRLELVLNRSNAQTGISSKAAEGVLRRKITHHVVNDYRTAIGSLNSGTPFMVNRPDSPIGKAVTKMARAMAEPRPEMETSLRLSPPAPPPMHGTSLVPATRWGE
jgi:pilus assembly protein CpaE